jgi:hypothetical protein
MLRAALISAAIAMTSSAAVAADSGGRIFVLRPPLPGKATGVLPPYAFEEVKPGNGGSTTTPPADNSGGYTFKSREWDLWDDKPITNITVSLSGSDISKRIIVTPPSVMANAVCRIIDQSGSPYVFASSYFMQLGGNVGRLDFQPTKTGTLAAVVTCQKEVPQGVMLHVERILITANP